MSLRPGAPPLILVLAAAVAGGRTSFIATGSISTPFDEGASFSTTPRLRHVPDETNTLMHVEQISRRRGGESYSRPRGCSSAWDQEPNPRFLVQLKPAGNGDRAVTDDCAGNRASEPALRVDSGHSSACSYLRARRARRNRLFARC